MSAISEAFATGGGWMWVITLLGLILFSLLAFQFVKLKTVNIIPILKGIFTALLITGPLGTFVGLIQAGWAIHDHFGKEGMDAARAIGAWNNGISIALNTTVYSLILAFFPAILIGIASYKINKLNS